ncbi:MAG: pyridoxamine 5'-phosphate oxidase family protein [Gemmatimonadota bacterium]
MSEPTHAEDAGSRTGRALTKEEIDGLLRRGFWGVLATSVRDAPYGVPIIYAYDDDGTFYIASGAGRKIDNVEQNPNVTLTIVEVEDYGRRWASVIVYGKAEIVSDLTARLGAFNALRKQIPRPAARIRDAARIAAAKVIRIVPTEMTGKAAG